MDLLIKNVNIVDGSGRAAYEGSVGVKNSKICLVKMGDCDLPAEKVIDGEGLHLSPGFIDCHSHGDQAIGQEPAMLSKVSQGITTEITGQCGGSIFPIHPDHLDDLQRLVAIGTYTFPDDMVNWTSFEKFACFAENAPKAINMKTFTGHSTLRIAAMGYKKGKPSSSEMNNMKAMLRECMQSGSIGLSSGLIYPPGCYSDTDEMVELAEIVAEYGGMYASHMRNESDNILAAVREALEIGYRASIPVCISHHKIMGRQNWGKAKDTLALIHEAIDKGVKVTIDHYPYTANYSHMNASIPPKYFENGGIAGMLKALEDRDTRQRISEEMQEMGTYDNFYINAGGFEGMYFSGCPKTPEADGKSVAEYAQIVGKNGFDTLFDVLLENEGKVNGVFHSISEEDNCLIIKDENATIGTDGSCRSLNEQTHPRTFGAFPRAICHYVRDKKLMSLEAMVRKLTGFAAERMGLERKGLIKEQYDADLVVFSYDNLKDSASFTQSTLLSDGIEYVIVNGKIAYTDKQMTPVRNGRLLYHIR